MNNDIRGTDFMALVRTKLANERTFLAYFRTFAVLLSSGLAIIKIDALQNLIGLGYFFLATSFLLIIIGVARFFYVKKTLQKNLFKDKQ
jgi:putative membrane protein